MSSEAENAKELEALKRQFYSRKGQVTTKRGNLQRAIDKIKSQDSWSEFSEKTIVSRVAEMEEQLKQLELLAEKLQEKISELEDDEEARKQMKDTWDQYEQYLDPCNEATDKAMDVLNDLRKAKARPAQTPTRSGDGGGNGAARERYKDNSSMKPEKLTLEHSVSWLNEWMKKIKVYVSSSNMETFPEDIGQGYIMTCLSDDLIKKIRPRINDHLPIYAANRHSKGLIDIIEEEFLREFPMITRRLELFNIRQEENESFSDLQTRLLSLLDGAAYEDITPDKLKSMLLLIAVRDKKLREQLLLTKSDNYEVLRETGLAYQAMTTANDKLSNDAAHANNAYPKGRKKSSNFKRSGGGKDNGKEWRKGPPVKDGKCTACGRNGGCQDLKEGCKARENKCNCGKKGHLPKYCYSKHLWSKGANATDMPDDQEDSSANETSEESDGGGEE